MKAPRGPAGTRGKVRVAMSESKRIYVAATARNDGKTTVAVGLMSTLRERVLRLGFIKPVGQRYIEVEGARIGEDSYLVAQVWGTSVPLRAMSPVAIDRGFTRRYIDGGDNSALRKSILAAFDQVAQGKDLVVIEGTGHAGVGSVMGLSNARVARLLRARVLLVTEGGIGRPIDEIMLNKALFDALGVPLAGVVINKVLPEKYDQVVRYVTRALEDHGIRPLGFIPREPVLARSTVRQIWENIGGEVLNGERAMDAIVERTVVGAMSPHRVLDYIVQPRTLLITPGDREDIIITAMIASRVAGAHGALISGIVLSGGVRPHQTVLNVIHHTQMPVILMREDTYRVASRIHDLIIKIQASDHDKIARAHELVARYVDVDRILSLADPLPPVESADEPPPPRAGTRCERHCDL